MRDLSKRLNKSLIRDYINNSNQTMDELAKKHGYADYSSACYQITKFFKLTPKDRKLALK